MVDAVRERWRKLREHIICIQMKLRALGCSALIFLPALSRAQTDSTRGEVRGVVYDSVARRPLSGAVVQLVLASDPARSISSVETNVRGEFVIGALVAGKYIIGFQHAALDTLALLSPMQLVEVTPGGRREVSLAVPSPRTIVTAVCHSPPDDSSGLVIGMLRDARTGLPLDTGYALARWSELIIEKGGLSQFEDHTQSIVNKDGWFVLCNVPGMDDLLLTGGIGSDSSGFQAVPVPSSGLVRRDIFLGGRATVRGTVRSERNQPIQNARVSFFGHGAPIRVDSTGAFVIYDAPAGSQTFEARAIGYAAQQVPMQLRAGADSTVPITLTSIKRVMDTIQVVATRLYNRDSFGFLRRKKQGAGGYFVDEAWIRKNRPFDAFQILNRIPSLHVSYSSSFQRNVLMRGHGGSCQPTLYMNGAKMTSELLADLDLWASPAEIEGIEVYREIDAPAQFHDFNNCGAIVIWTRPPRKG